MEKLVYLVWGAREPDPNAIRDRLLGDVAPRLLALDPRGLSVNVDDGDSDVPTSVPWPATELPLLAELSLWLDCHDRRGPYEAILGGLGVRRAGYLVTEALYTDYGRNTHHPGPRTWGDGVRSPGLLTVTLLEMPARFAGDDERWLAHWYGHQSPMSEAIQPRMRYVRNTVVRALTPGAPPYRGIVEEAWPSADHVRDPMLFYCAGGSTETLKRHAAMMTDSVAYFLDFDRIRNVTMSEYLLKT